MSFITGTQTELIYALPTPVTANTYTTERVISSAVTAATPRCLIPGNFFGYNGIGKGLYITGSGLVGATSGTNNLSLRLTWDPTPGTAGTTLAQFLTTYTVTASTDGRRLQLLGDDHLPGGVAHHDDTPGGRGLQYRGRRGGHDVQR